MLKIKYNLTMNHLISSNKFIYPTQISVDQQDDTKYHAEGLKNKLFYFVGLNKIRHNKKNNLFTCIYNLILFSFFRVFVRTNDRFSLKIGVSFIHFNH